jgi:hypothetical protein
MELQIYKFGNLLSTFGILDHSPMLVKMASLPKRKLPFKFFDFWADHPPFLPLIFET